MAPLVLIGCAGGVLTAWWVLQALLPHLPANMPRIASVGLNAPVVVFAVGVSFAVVFLAGLLPGRIAARSDPATALQQTSRSVSGSGGARNVLVIAQVAVTLILLFGGLLFARSFSALEQVKPGFSSGGVLTMHLAVSRSKYPQDEQVAAYYARLVERIRAIPGVTAAGIVNRLPFSGIAQTGGVAFEGHENGYDSDWRSVTPGYFEAMGIPLKQGRLILDTDTPQSPLVGLIDERLARTVFGSESPIGKRFRIYGPQVPWSVIVGVVGHIRNDNLEDDKRPQVYWPETQRTQDRAALAVRTASRPERYTQAVIEQIRKENADQPVYDIRTMDQWVDRTLETRTLLTGMVALFSAASLLLACLGLYGVVSYTADLRLREFGIRMALGAHSGHVRTLVLGHAGKLALLGSAVGLALAFPVARGLESLLFGVTGGDLFSWLAAPVILILVAVLAALVPASRAARAEPALTLRAE
jgi:predicted permease